MRIHANQSPVPQPRSVRTPRDRPVAYPKHPRILTTPDRTKRVRQTREEAKKESEEYRQSTEKKYRAYEAEVCS